MYHICCIIIFVFQTKIKQNKNAFLWVQMYLFYKFFVFWTDISQSRESKCDQFEPKVNVEKAETRDIINLSLMVKDEFKKSLRVREM